mmetsp:Transcript_108047/g.270946  ORF Transcript_108047/g.270946 Transcript_108047/m.270946 type:complete len:104 (-) Transcript_108047:2-313(-)
MRVLAPTDGFVTKTSKRFSAASATRGPLAAGCCPEEPAKAGARLARSKESAKAATAAMLRMERRAILFRKERCTDQIRMAGLSVAGALPGRRSDQDLLDPKMA